MGADVIVRCLQRKERCQQAVEEDTSVAASCPCSHQKENSRKMRENAKDTFEVQVMIEGTSFFTSFLKHKHSTAHFFSFSRENL